MKEIARFSRVTLIFPVLLSWDGEADEEAVKNSVGGGIVILDFVPLLFYTLTKFLSRTKRADTLEE